MVGMFSGSDSLLGIETQSFFWSHSALVLFSSANITLSFCFCEWKNWGFVLELIFNNHLALLVIFTVHLAKKKKRADWWHKYNCSVAALPTPLLGKIKGVLAYSDCKTKVKFSGHCCTTFPESLRSSVMKEEPVLDRSHTEKFFHWFWMFYLYVQNIQEQYLKYG